MAVKCPYCRTRWGSRYTRPKSGTTTNERVSVLPERCCTPTYLVVSAPLRPLDPASTRGRKNPHRSKIQQQIKRGMMGKRKKRNEARMEAFRRRNSQPQEKPGALLARYYDQVRTFAKSAGA